MVPHWFVTCWLKCTGPLFCKSVSSSVSNLTGGHQEQRLLEEVLVPVRKTRLGRFYPFNQIITAASPRPILRAFKSLPQELSTPVDIPRDQRKQRVFGLVEHLFSASYQPLAIAKSITCDEPPMPLLVGAFVIGSGGQRKCRRLSS